MLIFLFGSVVIKSEIFGRIVLKLPKMKLKKNVDGNHAVTYGKTGGGGGV